MSRHYQKRLPRREVFSGTVMVHKRLPWFSPQDRRTFRCAGWRGGCRNSADRGHLTPERHGSVKLEPPFDDGQCSSVPPNNHSTHDGTNFDNLHTVKNPSVHYLSYSAAVRSHSRSPYHGEFPNQRGSESTHVWNIALGEVSSDFVVLIWAGMTVHPTCSHYLWVARATPRACAVLF